MICYNIIILMWVWYGYNDMFMIYVYQRLYQPDMVMIHDIWLWYVVMIFGYNIVVIWLVTGWWMVGEWMLMVMKLWKMMGYEFQWGYHGSIPPQWDLLGSDDHRDTMGYNMDNGDINRYIGNSSIALLISWFILHAQLMYVEKKTSCQSTPEMICVWIS